MSSGSVTIGTLFFLLAGWMVYQQFRIAKADGDNDENWPATAELYKRQLRQVYALGICLIIVGAVLIALLLAPFQGGLNLADTWVVLPYRQQSLPLLLAVAFSAALIGDVFDRIIDQIEEMDAQAGAAAGVPEVGPWAVTKRYLRRRIPSHHRWLWWFLITLAFGLISNYVFEHSRLPTSQDVLRGIELEKASRVSATQPATPAAAAATPATPKGVGVQPATRPATAPSPAQPSRLASLWANDTVRLYAQVRLPAIVILTLFTGMLWFSYREWVRDHIQRKMVRVHKFGPKVVPQFMRDYNQREIPSQVIIIGPKKGGKSSAFQACGGPYVEDSTVPIFGGYHLEVPGINGAVRKLVSVGDMPGENMGDHLHYVRSYRSNRLVIVLNFKAFLAQDGTHGPLNQPGLFTLDSFTALCDQNPANQFSARTREYMTALKLALKRHNAGGGEYDVRGVSVVINYDITNPLEVTAVGQLSAEGLARLAAEISSKFDVNEWFRTDAYVASVKHNVLLQHWFAADYLVADPIPEPNGPHLLYGGEAQQKPRVWRV
jgi:hypothetical protein